MPSAPISAMGLSRSGLCDRPCSASPDKLNPSSSPKKRGGARGFARLMKIYRYKPGSGSEVPGARQDLSGRPTWIARRRWDKLPTIPRARYTARRQHHVWKRHEVIAGSTERVRRTGLPVLPELLQRGRDRAVARRRRGDPETRPPGSVARED